MTESARAAASELVEAALFLTTSRDSKVRAIAVLFLRRAMRILEETTEPYSLTDEELDDLRCQWYAQDPREWPDHA
jgi:hypothetical protein